MYLLTLQELEKLGLGESVDLLVREIPVEYQAIQRLMPTLWEEHQPQVCQRKHSVRFFQTPSYSLFSLAVLWAAGGPCGCVGVSHHCHSGAVRPQPGLPAAGQLQLLPSHSELRGERPRLPPLTAGHEHSVQESQRVRARRDPLCVRGRWKVSSGK